jgi:hypothetical protein
MATTESNRIGSITSINSINIQNITKNNSLTNLVTSVYSSSTNPSILPNSFKNLQILPNYIATPITKDNIAKIGFFDIFEYITYLTLNGVSQTVSDETSGLITGTYNDKNIVLSMNVSVLNKQFNFMIDLNKTLLITKDVISSETFQGKVVGYISSKTNTNVGLTGQNNLIGSVSININGSVSKGDLDAVIKGTFIGDFSGTINDRLISKSGNINQKIDIKIQHTNYIK